MREIAGECDRIAAANGFDPPTWENIVVKIALAITELDEARDAVHGVGVDPLGEELADTAIRILSILERLWPGEWIDRVNHERIKMYPVHVFAPIEVLLWPACGRLCKAIELRRHDNRLDTRTHLEWALADVFTLATSLGIDLTTEILMKCAKNSKRAQLHGKKFAGG